MRGGGGWALRWEGSEGWIIRDKVMKVRSEREEVIGLSSMMGDVLDVLKDCRSDALTEAGSRSREII